MEYKIKIGEKELILVHGDFDSVIDVDSLTTIDTSNLFGEATTISAAANRIGLLLSELGAKAALKKVELKLYEGTFKAGLRKQAAKNSNYYTVVIDGEETKVKATEKALDTCFETDEKWLKLKYACIELDKNFNSLTVLYENMRDKNRKLNGLIAGTTPSDFVGGIVEGEVNGILIKK